MARMRSDLPRMQKQAPARAPRSAPFAPAPTVEKPPAARKPPMMRQYDLIERVRRYNPDTNEALLNRAYVYAMKAHGEQRRASGDPYFSHPIEVAAILTDLKLDDATIAAALLHDTIEDTEATRAEIDSLFGHDIGRLVEGLTKLKKLDLVTKEAKQAENLRKLLLAIADDVRVLLIKLADRLHNMLYRAFPKANEGELSRRLADLVRKETCAEVARAMDLGPVLKLGSSESHAGGRRRTTILADVCEALVGAVFIDGGYDAADELIALFWNERMLKPLRPLRDPKTILQEWAQARGLPTPDYRELARTGPHHDPEFRVAVVLPDRPPAEGIGSSKRAAEQAAAAVMLTRVGVPADKLDG